MIFRNEDDRLAIQGEDCLLIGDHGGFALREGVILCLVVRRLDGLVLAEPGDRFVELVDNDFDCSQLRGPALVISSSSWSSPPPRAPR